MRTTKQLSEDIAILEKELVDLRAFCQHENRDPNADERTKANAKMDEIEELEDMVKVLNRENETRDRINSSIAPPDKPAVNSREEARKIDERNEFGNTGEYLQAVMNAGTPGRSVDPRLSTRAATGMSESVPSDGGFLVNSEFSNTIMENVWTSGEILSRINKITLSGNKNSLKMNGLDETSRADGSRQGGIRGYWKAEAAQATAGEPTWRQISLELNKLMCLAYATDEVMDDTNALASMITTGFANELRFKLEAAIIAGTGAGQPLGVINSGCVVSVGKETGQTADTIVFENVNKMWSRLIAGSRPNSIWLINQECEVELHQMSLAVGTGGSSIYMPQGGAAQSPFQTLYGRPVIPVEHCPILGDTGDIMLCDFSNYVGIDKGGMNADVSMHLRFDYGEQVFRMTYRFDGQPMLANSILPYSAGSTTATKRLSHFVKLNERA